MKQSKPERKSAVALSFNQNMNEAPVLLAKGSGDAADRIIEAAKKYGVPLQEDESLLSLLSQLEIHQQIPPELYEVVAELFVFVYKLDQNVKSSS
jgi:flagellar biosynthesis protein